MTQLRKKVRTVGGFLAILTLLAMLLMEFLFPELHVNNRALVTLVSLISALLGVDVAATRGGELLTLFKEIMNNK